MFLHHQEGATFARGHEYKRRHATTARLTLAQTCVPEKTDEITAIPIFSMNSPKSASSKVR
jgi:hypothetical protein